MSKVSSFDVFDTCLARRLAVPSSAFYEVAKRAFLKLGLPFNRPVAEDFVIARMQAERTARGRSGREDTTLDDIWRNLSETMGWRHDESLARCELDVEEELLVPISQVRMQVQADRRQGRRIIFVSDMYLPKEFIERQLVKHGFAQAGDGFYVSGDLGKTKGSGNLFRHLLAQEKVPASDVFHTGDNRHTDYTVPRKLGINARLFPRSKLTRAEISVMQTGQDSRTGAVIAGAMRAFRLGCESNDKRDIHELVSQFVAPFIMAFATWVLQRARENGVRRLYFMSRDCQLVWKVARELSPQFGGIDCRYLYISRQALFLPSADAISPEEMPWMTGLYKEPILDRLLTLIELDYSEADSSFRTLTGNKRGAYRLKSAKDWDYFWNALNEEPLKSRVMKLVAARREAALGYFESAGLFDPEPWAVVDLGWTLKCQQALRKLLRSAKWPGQMTGYYSQIAQSRINRTEAGDAEALFYECAPDYPYISRTYPHISPSLTSNVELIEHVVGCADHPTVHHYEKANAEMRPAFGGVMDQPTLEFCRELHDLALEFVRRNRALTEDFSDAAICREMMQSLATSFIRFPTKETAGSLQKLSAVSDLHSTVLPIVKPFSIGTALLILLPKREPFVRLLKNKGCFWFEGSLAMTSPGVGRLASLVEYAHSNARRFFIKNILPYVRHFRESFAGMIRS